MGGPPKPGPASAANMSKQGLSARHYAPNQTPIMVNARLPKGIWLREIKAGGAVTGAGPTGSRGQSVRNPANDREVQVHILAARYARDLPERCPSKSEGAGNVGCPM